MLVCCLAIQSLSLRCVTLAFLRCLCRGVFLDLPRDETEEDFHGCEVVIDGMHKEVIWPR